MVSDTKLTSETAPEGITGKCLVMTTSGCRANHEHLSGHYV